jgi:putrescine aminotransferase
MCKSSPKKSTAWIERDQQVVQHPGVGGGEHTVVLSHGKGATVWDVDGNAYLDAQGGAWLNKVGYGRQDLAQVAARQMEQLAHFAFGFDYTNPAAIECAEKLVARAPDSIAAVRFMNGGGEADDHALQLARIYHHQKGNSKRRKVVVHRNAYHGSTMGGVELAGGRAGVAAPSDDIIFLTSPRPYHQELFDARNLTAFCVDELRAAIATHGADTIAAMFGELIIGPGGMIPPPDDYWPAMTAVLKQHGILFVADTTAGQGPGNSYAGHAVGAAVASAHIDIIENEKLLDNTIARGEQIMRELAPLRDHPLVGDIHGRGLMIGIELVADKDSREPLTDVAPELAATLPRYLRREHGILLLIRNSTILLTPPLVISESEATRICHAVGDAVNRIERNDSGGIMGLNT